MPLPAPPWVAWVAVRSRAIQYDFYLACVVDTACRVGRRLNEHQVDSEEGLFPYVMAHFVEKFLLHTAAAGRRNGVRWRAVMRERKKKKNLKKFCTWLRSGDNRAVSFGGTSGSPRSDQHGNGRSTWSAPVVVDISNFPSPRLFYFRRRDLLWRTTHLVWHRARVWSPGMRHTSSMMCT
jgi:hypothetical protein